MPGNLKRSLAAHVKAAIEGEPPKLASPVQALGIQAKVQEPAGERRLVASHVQTAVAGIQAKMQSARGGRQLAAHVQRAVRAPNLNAPGVVDPVKLLGGRPGIPVVAAPPGPAQPRMPGPQPFPLRLPHSVVAQRKTARPEPVHLPAAPASALHQRAGQPTAVWMRKVHTETAWLGGTSSQGAVVQRAGFMNYFKDGFWVASTPGNYEWRVGEPDLGTYYATGEQHSSRFHFFAYPVYRRRIPDPPAELIAHDIPNQLDYPLWTGLVGNVPVESRNGRPLVDYLFERFVSRHIGYDVMGGLGPAWVLDIDQNQNAASSCRALAATFRQILASYGIRAEVRDVRTEAQGPFVVRIDRFIDRRLNGHIYDGGYRLIPGYYKFSSHAATFVPQLNRYYDPMATSSYEQFEFDAQLEPGNDDNEYRSTIGPRTITNGQDFELVDLGQQIAGGFRKMFLRRV